MAVADVMRGAGLTHGGLYTHFASKQELMALACRRAVADMLEDWRDRADAAPGDPLAANANAAAGAVRAVRYIRTASSRSSGEYGPG